jgi:hypothetical protein
MVPPRTHHETAAAHHRPARPGCTAHGAGKDWGFNMNVTLRIQVEAVAKE